MSTLFPFKGIILGAILVLILAAFQEWRIQKRESMDHHDAHESKP